MTRKMLIAEDNASFRARLAQALRRRGLEVATAKNKLEAVAETIRHRPQWAVLELRLPPNSALEVIPLLLQHSPRLEIIVMSEFGTIAAATKAIRLGAKDFLPKPFTVEQLLKQFHGLNIIGQFMSSELEAAAPLPSLAQAEWEHINRVMDLTDNNVSEAARQLQIDRRSLQRKLQRPVRTV